MSENTSSIPFSAQMRSSNSDMSTAFKPSFTSAYGYITQLGKIIHYENGIFDIFKVEDGLFVEYTDGTTKTLPIDESAEIVVDAALSSESTNPVQNKVINAALGNKVDAVSGKGLSTNDYTTAEKNKLSGIAANANNYSLPTAGTNALGGVKTTSTVDSANGLTASPIVNGVVYYHDTTYGNVTTSAAGLMSAADKSKLNGFSDASNYALKSDIVNMYKYKGSVASYALLPSTGNVNGDVYNVETDGQNYAWNGTAWDSLGGVFAVSEITNSDIDAILSL
jgi:hypothetical protein